jgi:steroid delta-isomerase-like uncharacterized protein
MLIRERIMPTSTNQINVDLVRRLQASWSDTDPESFVSLFTDDGVFEDKTYGILSRGEEALRAHARRVKKHNVDLRIDIVACDATDETGVAEWRLSHVFVGNFDGIDCTGRPITIEGLSIYRFRDGLIARATDYWNYMEIVRCVEVLPKELRGFRTC